ncbi:MAG: phosphonoacetaldehyde hydrolase [Candidatus Latescibacteria bacterium]|nr:phosphonoacetaldehyde hydrolase [Candidatus Latescibacterota bacterium]
MSFTYSRCYTGELKAVLLDWAGTTMDYGCYAPAVVFMEVFKRRQVPISIAEARLPMGAHKMVHIRQITRIERVAAEWERVHGSRPNEEDVEAMFKEFVPLQLDCLADYSDLIPGTLETVAAIRERGLKIGSTTGYTGEMMEILLSEAKKRGYEPDSTVCATDVPAGRPDPWMCIQNAMNLGIYPMESIVKIGDTLPDIAEGLNAGMWTIGLAKTGNEIGLNEAEVNALPKDELDERLDAARTRMYQTGAHYVVDGIADVLPIIDTINGRLSRGERS